jgi:hypothetical protein
VIRGGEARPSDPRLAAMFDLLDRHKAEFARDAARAGLDVRCTNEISGSPNRARIKAFAPDANVLVVFVYKDSQVPFSDDRFSYGAAVLKRGFDAGAVERVVEFALSGLDPARRPADVRKTFPYTVPR